MENTYEENDDDRKAEIQSCKKKLRSYKNKVDTLEEKVHTLEQKVEVLEEQIGDKKRKKRKISGPVTNSEETSNDAPFFTPFIIRTKLENEILDVVKRCGGELYEYVTAFLFMFRYSSPRLVDDLMITKPILMLELM